jgi:hypothetical protein
LPEAAAIFRVIGVPAMLPCRHYSPKFRQQGDAWQSSQVNYIIPSGTAPGDATLTVTSGDGSVSSGTLEIRPVVPIVFCGERS